MKRIRLKGEFGEVEIEGTAVNVLNVNGDPVIEDNISIYDAIKAYEALREISEKGDNHV